MKTDFKRKIEAYTARRGIFSIVDVPRLQHLMVDGRGDPNTSPVYRDALAALYPVAYKIKFLSKTELDRDYVVMPLEGLWWSEDLASFTRDRDPSRWEWTMMIMVPGWITHDHLEVARAAVAHKAPGPALDGVRLEQLEEGLSMQTLHVGSYTDEGPVLEAMHHDVIPAHDLSMTGKHHEIYLSDARRTPPSGLRTILRQPVVRQDPQPSGRSTK